MKRKNLFILLVSSLLTLGLSSCGSDNEGKPVPTVSSASPVGALDPNYEQTSCPTANGYNDFRGKVHAGQFITETRDIESYTIGSYRFEERDGWWIFDTYNYTRIGSTTRVGYKGVDRAVHEQGNSKSAILDHLKYIVDQAVNHQGAGGYHEVLHSDGTIYGINLCSPIAANPVYVRNSDNSVEILEYSSSNMNGFNYPSNNFYRFY